MKRRGIYLLLILLCHWTQKDAHGQLPASQDSGIAALEMLLQRVERHPSIAVQHALIEAARRRISSRSSLADPMLMLGVQNLPTNSFSFHDDMMTSKMIGISQAFSFPGKLAAEEAIAAQDTVAGYSSLAIERLGLRRDVKMAYFDLYHLERALETDRHHLMSLVDLLEAAQARLALGKSTQQEILSLTLERSSIDDDVVQLQSEIVIRESDLQALTGGQDSIKGAEQLAMPPFKLSLGELDSIALRHSPAFENIRSKIAQSELQVKRNDLEKYPDFAVMLSYMQRDALTGAAAIPMTDLKQSNMISATVSVDLPINNNNKRADAIGEAEAMREMHLADLHAAMISVHAQLRSALAKLTGLRKRYTLLREDVYPTIMTSLKTVNANYSYGQGDLEEVVRIELSVLHHEHDRYQIESDYNSTLAQIDYLVGEDLTRYSTMNDWESVTNHHDH
jgi:cobalt-zinc-cadmium efflux system outer membrane protein